MQIEDGQLIRALIVSDNHIMRAGLRRILESQSKILLIGEVSVANTSTLDALLLQHPDIVLVDLDPHGMDVLGFIRNVRKGSRNTVVLVLSDLDDDQLARKALSLGATGVVLKVQPPPVLIAAIQNLCGRNLEHTELRRVEADTIVASTFGPRQNPGQNMAKINSLTAREREIIRLIAVGLKNKDVANRLHISDITVRHHLTSIFSKLEVSDRQKLLLLAHRHGLVELTVIPEAT